MLSRKIEKDVNNWIDNSNKALLISGVRQSGKTYIIRKCLKEKKCDYVELNLINEPEIITLLNSCSNADDLLLRLSLYCKNPLIERKTIIFFDEIQRCKEIVTKIKFLVEDNRFRYILSGSLLGVELVNIISAPVGYLETLYIYPLDFEEFIQIFNVKEKIIEILKKSFQQKVPVDSVIHDRLMEIFRLYMIIGGMPAAVEKYVETNNINEVITEHNAIIEQYKLDFTRYEVENKKLQLTHIYEMIPTELNSKNKRFMIADINRKPRLEQVEDSFTWLTKAGVALPVYNVTDLTFPLKLNLKNTLFKLFISDIGLLTTMYGKTTKLKIISKESNINLGSVYENVAAQELSAHGFEGYYYNNKKLGEIDFVIEYRDEILPIEIKSGKDYERHSALNNVMKIQNYGLNDAFVFTDYNVKNDGKITYYPIYMLMFLSKEDETIQIKSVKSLSF